MLITVFVSPSFVPALFVVRGPLRLEGAFKRSSLNIQGIFFFRQGCGSLVSLPVSSLASSGSGGGSLGWFLTPSDSGDRLEIVCRSVCSTEHQLREGQQIRPGWKVVVGGDPRDGSQKAAPRLLGWRSKCGSWGGLRRGLVCWGGSLNCETDWVVEGLGGIWNMVVLVRVRREQTRQM